MAGSISDDTVNSIIKVYIFMKRKTMRNLMLRYVKTEKAKK